MGGGWRGAARGGVGVYRGCERGTGRGSGSNFWQSYPGSLECDGGDVGGRAHVTAWLWSPEGPAMDMRHYDTHGHGNVNTGGSYEDYEPAFATLGGGSADE